MVTCSWRHTQTTTWVRVFLDWINAHFQAPAYHRNAQTHIQCCTFVQIILKNSIFQSHKRFTTFKICRRHAKQKQKRETNKIHTNKLDDEFLLKFGAALTYAKTRWVQNAHMKNKRTYERSPPKNQLFSNTTDRQKLFNRVHSKSKTDRTWLVCFSSFINFFST